MYTSTQTTNMLINSQVRPIEAPMHIVPSKWSNLMNQQRIPFTTCEDLNFIKVYPIGLRFIEEAQAQANKFGWL